MRVALITTVLACIALSATAELSNLWTGNTDANNDGDWSDDSNWEFMAPGVDETAVLPDVFGLGSSGDNIRTVTTNSAITVAGVTMEQSDTTFFNELVLNGDLTAGTFTTPTDDGQTRNCRVYLGSNTLTLDTIKNGLPKIFGDATSKVVKNGSSTDYLRTPAAHDFLGQLVINDGQIEANQEIPANCTVVVNGGTLRYGDWACYSAEAAAWILNGLGFGEPGEEVGAFWWLGRGASKTSYSGPVTFQTDTAIRVDTGNGDTFTLNGPVDGDGGLTKLGLGTLVLNGTNSYTGITTVAAGTLQVSSPIANVVVVKDGATLLGPPTMFPGGEAGVTVETGGTWVAGPNAWIGNDDGDWGTGTNWTHGTAPATDGIAVLGTVTDNGSSGDNTRTITTSSAITVAGVTMEQSDTTFFNELVLNGDLTAGTFTTPTDDGQTRNCRVYLGSNTLTLDTIKNGLPKIFGDATSKVVKNGSSTDYLRTPAAHDFLGQLVINDGQIEANQEIPANCTVVVNGGTLRYGDWACYSAEAAAWILNGLGFGEPGEEVGAFWWLGKGASKTTFAGPVTFQTDTAIRVDVEQDRDTFTLNGPVDGDGGLTKLGLGTLVLNGTNSYTGITTVAAGTLQVNSPIANVVVVKDGATLLGPPMMFPGGEAGVTVEPGGTWVAGPNAWIGNDDGDWGTGTNWTHGTAPATDGIAVLGTVTDNGSSGDNTRTITTSSAITVAGVTMEQSDTTFFNELVLNGDLTAGTFTTPTDDGQTRNCRVYLGSNTLTLDTIKNGLPKIFGDATSKVVKNGSSTDYLRTPAAHDFLGQLVINDGQIEANQEIPANCTVVVNGGTLRYGDWACYSAEAAAWILNGLGFGEPGEEVGAFWWLGKGASKTTFAGPVTFQTDTAIRVNVEQDRDTFTLNGPVDGDGGLTKLGPGTLVLNGSNSYTGVTTVSAGTLQVNSPLAGTVVVKDGATLLGPPMMFPGGEAGVTVEFGGRWDPGPNAWIGNDNGNWSGDTNWTHGTKPTTEQVAILGNVTADGGLGDNARTVTVDEQTTVAGLEMTQYDASFYNDVSLAANLTAGTVTIGGNRYRTRMLLGGHTFTFVSISGGNFFVPQSEEGDGSQIVKDGYGETSLTFDSGADFYGSWVVNDGVLNAYVCNGRFQNSTVDVRDGGTFRLYDARWSPPGAIILSGLGHGKPGAELGAFHRADYGDGVNPLILGCPVTLASTAGIYVTAGKTVKLTGAIDGPGGLTKIGAGTLALAGTCATDVTVARGTLAIEDDLIDDEKVLGVSMGAKLDVADFADEHVAQLFFNGEPQKKGSWGMTGSGADNINDLYFSGRTGIVTVDTSLTLEGDVNGDCVVNILDLIGIRNHLNQGPTTPAENKAYDVNDDGSINILDMIYVRNRLNTSCP